MGRFTLHFGEASYLLDVSQQRCFFVPVVVYFKYDEDRSRFSLPRSFQIDPTTLILFL
jgi:hypothetical protein